MYALKTKKVYTSTLAYQATVLSSITWHANLLNKTGRSIGVSRLKPEATGEEKRWSMPARKSLRTLKEVETIENLKPQSGHNLDLGHPAFIFSSTTRICHLFRRRAAARSAILREATLFSSPFLTVSCHLFFLTREYRRIYIRIILWPMYACVFLLSRDMVFCHDRTSTNTCSLQQIL